MGKKQVHLLIEEHIWEQFQTMYHRQATKTIEETMRSMINMKLDITDDEGEELKNEREEIQKKIDTLANRLKEHDMKIRSWETKKREALVKKKHELEQSYKEAGIQGRAIRASGILEKVRLQ